MPVKLYDGSITSLPQTCSLAAVSSINMIGSMRGLSLTNLGSGWVVSTPPNGGQYTRRLGTLAEAGECHLERTGTLAFYSGFVPLAGEQIAVSYRTHGPGDWPRGQRNQPTATCRSWLTFDRNMDGLGDKSSGAQFCRLP